MGVFVRLFTVGLTVASLMLVAVLGVSATSTSGKAESSKVFNSVASVVSGHFDQIAPTTSDNNKNKDKDKECKPPKKEHDHVTPGHEHHPCNEDESGGAEDESG